MSSPIYQAGKSWSAEAARLRQAGISLPYSPTAARREAMNAATSVQNRTLVSQMNRSRLASYRGRQHTGANLQIAMPKIRQPLGTLADQGIPYDVENDEELQEIRRWSRLFYSTHDLVPLLIDIYASFPTVGLEFTCFAAGTPVLTDAGTLPIEELAGGVHRVLTTGGKWVEAPFKSFGVQPLQHVVVQRNGRQREFYATPGHRWFVEQYHKPRRGRNSARWSPLTWEKVDAIRALYTQGARQVDIAAQFGVSQVMISKIVNHKAWTEEQRRAEASRPEPGHHRVIVRTEDLKPGMRLPSVYGRNLTRDTNPSPFGVAHGMTFGDGTRTTSGGGCTVDLFGEKDANLLPYFAGCTQYRYPHASYRGEWVRVSNLPRFFKDRPPLTESTSYLYGWLAGYFAADGTVSKKGECFLDSARKGDIDHAQAVCQLLGIKTSDPYVIKATGQEVVFPQGGTFIRGDYYRLRLANESLAEAFFCIPEHRERWAAHQDRRSLEQWTVVSVEETDRVEEVYCAVVPGTEAFALAGNILTANCKDPLIERFYTDMFLGDDLNYLEFLPTQFSREYFLSGEVTSLAHFNESLGIWSSEEILNPDTLRVSRSLFVQQDRVQLMVKEMVDSLRNGPSGTGSGADETPSERLERMKEWETLAREYPEIVQAAAQDDGLDISDALISRVVNRATPWARRGTPFLLRSFRTLMMEESLNAAQQAVCVPAGTPVLTSQGVKCIEDVTAGDEVLTHRGRYREVLRPMVRQADEPGVTICWWYDKPLTLTGEHPVYIRRKLIQRGVCAVCRTPLRDSHRAPRRTTVCDEHLASRIEPSGRIQRAVCCVCGDKANAPKSIHCDLHDPDKQEWVEGFIPAREVRIYDQVLHPSSPELSKEYVSVWEHLAPSDWVVYDPDDDALGMTGHDWYDGAATQTRRVARNRARTVINTCQANPGDILRHNRFRAKTQHFSAEYKLTDDLLWLIGLHVADGSATINAGRLKDKPPHGSVVISLGTDEIEIQQRAVRVIRETFGIESTVRPAWGGKKAVNVTANCLPLAAWFREMCGVKSTKRFPSWAFTLPPEQTACLVAGWLDGDGSRTKEHVNGYAYQRTLQESAAWLIRRAGFVSTVHRDCHDRGHTGGNVGVIGCQTDAFVHALGLSEMRSTVAQTGRSRRAYPSEQGGYWVEVRSVDHHQVTEAVYNLEVEEDHSYCAPVAVHNCDRLYSPMVLATLGVPDLGDGEPWIPDQSELDDVRDDMQSALAADFRLLVHNFGLKIESVFGREAVPNLDNDYARVERKLLQAWGIGEALISGGTGGAYASSALNREVCSVPPDVRAPILQSWRGGPVLRTMEQVWDQAAKHRDVQQYGVQEVIDFPTNNNSIYTVCFSHGMGQWGKIKRIMRHRYDGDIVRLNQKWGECRVTANHSVYAANGDLVNPTVNPELLAVRYLNQPHPVAGDEVRLTLKNSRIEGDWSYRYKRNDTIEKRSRLRNSYKGDQLHDLMRFLGAWIAEGSAHITARGAAVVDVSNNDQEWLKSISEAVSTLIGDEGGRSIQRSVETENQNYNLVMHGRPLAEWLIANAGKGAANKRLPDFVFGLHREYIDTLIEAMVFGDGSTPSSGNWRYFTLSEELAQGVTLLCLLHGIQYTVDKDRRTGVYLIRTCSSYSSRPDERRDIETTHYSGWVYDFEMEDQSVANFTIGVGQPVVHNTQIMVGHQNALRRHIIKRAEIVAEAQGHYDYDLKGGVRVPIYREIVEVDPDTGEERIRKVPKLLIPEVKMATLNLRDEAQERAFIAQLKAMGVPVSDKTLAVNIDMEFDQELERQADESVSKLMATAQAMKKVQDLCDAQNLPYPPELAQHLMATLQLRQGMSQTETAEIQAEVMGDQAGLQIEQIEMQKAMMEQQMAGGAPMLPPGAPAPGQGGSPPGQGGPAPEQGGGPGPGQGGPPAQGPDAPGPGAPGPGNAPMGYYASLNTNGPMATPPRADGPAASMGPELPPGVPNPTEIPRNRQRPAESDDNRKFMPAQTTAKRKRTRKGEVVEQLPRRLSKFERGPSSYGASRRATEEQVSQQVDRLATVASWNPGRDPKVSDLVNDPDFYRALNATQYMSQIQADWPEIQAGGASESKKLLDDLLDQFFEVFGSWPQF